MATLVEDIKTQADWLVKAFEADEMKLDYTLESFKAIDRFFDLHTEDGKAKPGGRLSQNRGPIIFSIGSYVGETILRNVPGAKWVTDDSDPAGELSAEIKLPDGASIFPIQRVVNRFNEGPEDSIYPYGFVVITQMAKGDYWDKMKEQAKIQQAGHHPRQKKRWWRFWSANG
jgi:hypothetical protein